jgi:hypothetical protein
LRESLNMRRYAPIKFSHAGAVDRVGAGLSYTVTLEEIAGRRPCSTWSISRTTVTPHRSYREIRF